MGLTRLKPKKKLTEIFFDLDQSSLPSRPPWWAKNNIVGERRKGRERERQGREKRERKGRERERERKGRERKGREREKGERKKGERKKGEREREKKKAAVSVAKKEICSTWTNPRVAFTQTRNTACAQFWGFSCPSNQTSRAEGSDILLDTSLQIFRECQSNWPESKLAQANFGQAKRLKHQCWSKPAWPMSATQMLAKVGQLRWAKVGQILATVGLANRIGQSRYQQPVLLGVDACPLHSALPKSWKGQRSCGSETMASGGGGISTGGTSAVCWLCGKMCCQRLRRQGRCVGTSEPVSTFAGGCEHLGGQRCFRGRANVLCQSDCRWHPLETLPNPKMVGQKSDWPKLDVPPAAPRPESNNDVGS